MRNPLKKAPGVALQGFFCTETKKLKEYGNLLKKEKLTNIFL